MTVSLTTRLKPLCPNEIGIPTHVEPVNPPKHDMHGESR